MEKIISYSLYLSDRNSSKFYFNGLMLNLDRIKLLYPDYNVIIYLHDKLIHYKYSLESKGANVIIKSCDKNNHIPALWRYQPLIDNNFDIVLFRDADSLIYQRERDLVKLFEDSDKSYHIIRDHPHHTMKILAGMWGAKKTTPEIINVILNCYNKDGVYGFEEKFFQENLYNKIYIDALEHDSNITPQIFNTYLNESFIGSPYI